MNGKIDAVATPNTFTRTNKIPLRFGKPGAGSGTCWSMRLCEADNIIVRTGAWRPIHQSGYFDGMIDDISIWGVVLEEEQIAACMFRCVSLFLIELSWLTFYLKTGGL